MTMSDQKAGEALLRVMSCVPAPTGGDFVDDFDYVDPMSPGAIRPPGAPPGAPKRPGGRPRCRFEGDQLVAEAGSDRVVIELAEGIEPDIRRSVAGGTQIVCTSAAPTSVQITIAGAFTADELKGR